MASESQVPQPARLAGVAGPGAAGAWSRARVNEADVLVTTASRGSRLDQHEVRPDSGGQSALGLGQGGRLCGAGRKLPISIECWERLLARGSRRTDRFMASAKVVERTRRAVSEVLRRQGYVSAVDMLLQMGTLEQQDLEDWRSGRVPFLERKVMGSLRKLSVTLSEMRRLCAELGLKPSQTAYTKRGKGPKRPLRFSKSGERHVEEAYRTHWVSQRVAKPDSPRGVSRATAKPN